MSTFIQTDLVRSSAAFIRTSDRALATTVWLNGSHAAMFLNHFRVFTPCSWLGEFTQVDRGMFPAQPLVWLSTTQMTRDEIPGIECFLPSSGAAKAALRHLWADQVRQALQRRTFEDLDFLAI